MPGIRITEHTAEPTAGIRETVPMDRLTEFFGRAFHLTMQAMQAQGVPPAGPPFGKYYGMPGAAADVEAGFPVARAIVPDGDVVPGELPEATIVEAVHVGPYDTLDQTYAEIQRHILEHGLLPGDVMWESYLSDPDVEPDPATWRTRVCWVVARE